MDKLQWLKDRQKGIGGSDVGAIMGMNKWKTAFQVYVEKTESIGSVPEVYESAYWGNTMDMLVAREFTKRTELKVRKDNRHLVHKDYPFMMANINRRVLGENSILQCKTANAYSAKEWEGEEIPPSFLLQCQHNMAVTGADKCYLAVLIGGQKFLIKMVERDEELINLIQACEKDFWTNHVEKRVPPPLDGSSAAERYLKEKCPRSNSSLEIGLASEFKDKIDKYQSLKGYISSLQEEAKALENNIKHELGEAEVGRVENFTVNWRTVVTNRVDSKILKEKYPEVYKEVCREAATRRFEVRS